MSADVKEYEKHMQNVVSLEGGVNVNIRHRTNYNKAKTSAHLASVKVDKRGTWKFWKWRFYEQKGHVLFEKMEDSEYGFEITAFGGISQTVTFPFAAISTGAVGVYADTGFEMGYSGVVNIGGSHYVRNCSYDYAHSDFNLALIPSGAEKHSHKWTPSASEFDLYFTGNAKGGFYGKAGIRILKMTCIELKANAGLFVDGYAGYRRRKVHYDENNFDDYIKSLPSHLTFDDFKEFYKTEMANLKKYSDLNHGLANIAVKAGVDVDVTILSIIKSKIFSLKYPFLSDKGFEEDDLKIDFVYKKEDY